MKSLVMNPILKKELRVGARTVKFSIALMCYSLFTALAASVVLMLGATINYQVEYQIFTNAFPVLVFMQIAMICFIVPVITASSISGEREKQTLDIMLTTPVSPMTIMLGKLLASLSQVTMFLICSLPGMAICFIYGGLRWSYLVQFFFQSILLAFFIGSMGVWCSAMFRKSLVSIIMTMLCELIFFAGPIVLIAGVYMVKYQAYLRMGIDPTGTMIYMGMVPIIALLDPMIGFVHAIVSVCYNSDIVAQLVLVGNSYDIYRTARALESVLKVWNLIHPVITVAMGFAFLHLAGQSIDHTRRKNKALTEDRQAKV